MAQNNRSKELWLIPKRVNLHQTICLIDGIINRNYSKTTWNSQKQNNLGVNLRNWGATNTGRNISSQAIRTLVASIPQYLGFLYINTDSTPNTICLTDAGLKLWEAHKKDLEKIPNLREGGDKLITESEILLHQMEKLQITNPIILKDCENIFVFPFRMTLKLLLELGYLDREELAYIVFKIKDESEFNLSKQQILQFRQQSLSDRKKIIEEFKKTHIGNITLVQASSASYYESLCNTTGIIDKFEVTVPNPTKDEHYKLKAIKIKPECVDYVNDVIHVIFDDVKTYDFKDNLQLWIDYIGNPIRKTPPREISIRNKGENEILICIKKDNALLDGDLFTKDQIYVFPMFLDEEYIVEAIDIHDGSLLSVIPIIPKVDELDFYIETSEKQVISEESFENIKSDIISHSSSSKFNKKTLDYLQILYNIDGKVREDDKYLRGAYYEYFFYKLLSTLENERVIDDVIWNGKTGKYGLPNPAPGGRTGTPDIIFRINDIDFVLEVTTIRPKSTQFRAEGASVPDHVRLYSNSSPNNVIGIFCAPEIHSRNTNVMKTSLNKDSIDLICIKEEELLEIFSLQDRNKIVESLKLNI